jgi:hypothetical protein
MGHSAKFSEKLFLKSINLLRTLEIRKNIKKKKKCKEKMQRKNLRTGTKLSRSEPDGSTRTY